MSEKDDFWDLSKLVPGRKKAMGSFSTSPKTVSIEIAGGECEGTDPEQRKLNIADNAGMHVADSSKTYYPESGLIKSVTVSHIPDKYDFHANFAKAADLYFYHKTDKCDFVSFYSYMPQYIQLTPPQKSYYFYFRNMVRQNKFIKTDYSYLYLLVYEILNLPELVKPTDGVKMLGKLWREYRASLPQIDQNMAAWIRDYCLVYQLRPPMDIIGEFVFDVLSTVEFKEFYLSEADAGSDEGTGSLISYLSDYDYRRGKYAGGDGKEIYARNMLGAMRTVTVRLLKDGKLAAHGEVQKFERMAFRPAIVTSPVKYKIECEYSSLGTKPEARAIVTAAVKYTENKLRALLGVKSRLAVKDLPDEYRALVDKYFEEMFHRANLERQRAQRPEYEKQYEAESHELSMDGADMIERASWGTTMRLVEENLEEDDEIIESSAQKTSEAEVSGELLDNYSLSDRDISFLNACYRGEIPEMHSIANMEFESCDAPAERINEAFADNFGDVILDLCDGEYSVIEDYREDVGIWLSKRMK